MSVFDRSQLDKNTGNFTGQPIPAFLQISAAQCAQATVTAIDDAVVLAVPHVFVRLGLALLPFVPRFVVRLVLAPAGRKLRALQIAAEAGSHR
jgi:hypothetical protein